MAKKKEIETGEEQSFTKRLTELDNVLIELSAKYDSLLSEVRASGQTLPGYRRLAKVRFGLAGLTAGIVSQKKERSKEVADLFAIRNVTEPTERKNAPAPDLFAAGRKQFEYTSARINPPAPDLFKQVPKKEEAPKPEPKPGKVAGGKILASSEDQEQE